MRALSQDELERLLRSHRRLKMSALATITVLVAAIVLVMFTGVPFLAGAGAGLGMGIGALLALPKRRLVNELGITALEATMIIRAERERRSGLADLPPATRARREARLAGVSLAAGVILTIVLIVSAVYFFGHAGQTVEEGAPLDLWFAASFFAGFVSLCAGPLFLLQASTHRKLAASWRAATKKG
jgi:hypothetical protein